LKITEIRAKYNTIEIRIICIIGNNSIQSRYDNKIIGESDTKMIDKSKKHKRETPFYKYLKQPRIENRIPIGD